MSLSILGSGNLGAQQFSVPQEGETIRKWLSRNPLHFYGTPEEFIEQSEATRENLENFFAKNYAVKNLTSLYIKRNPEVIRIIGEYSARGTILKNNEMFPKLEEGVTVYILYMYQGRIEPIYSSEVPDLNVDPNGDVLVTHRSLITQLEKQGYDGVLAAGEIKVLNGYVSEINNRSNTFPGQRNNLDLAVVFLKNKGVEIGSDARFTDYSNPESVKILHSTSVQRAKFLVKLHNNPYYIKIKELQKKIADKYPHEGIPGGVDYNFLYSVLPPEYYEVINVCSLLETEGAMVFVESELNKEDSSRLDDVISQMEKLANYSDNGSNFKPGDMVTEKDVRFLINEGFVLELFNTAKTITDMDERLVELLKVNDVIGGIAKLSLNRTQKAELQVIADDVYKEMKTTDIKLRGVSSTRSAVINKLGLSNSITDSDLDKEVSNATLSIITGNLDENAASSLEIFYSYMGSRIKKIPVTDPALGDFETKMSMIEVLIMSIDGSHGYERISKMKSKVEQKPFDIEMPKFKAEGMNIEIKKIEFRK